MDLFGKQRRATQAAIEGVRPLIGMIQHLYGLPPRFWMDDFVLGFTGFLIATLAKEACNLTQVQKGRVFADAFSALSNQNGEAIALRATLLVKNPTPDFIRGRDNATTVFLYSLGRLADEDKNAEVQAAKQAAVRQGNDSRQTISDVLIERLFYQVVIARFELRNP